MVLAVLDLNVSLPDAQQWIARLSHSVQRKVPSFFDRTGV